MNRRINIYILNIIIFLQGFVFYAPISTIYRENKGISIAQVFLIEAFYMIFIIILEIPWGRFADKFGYKRTIVLANFIFFLSKIVFFKADSFNLFFIERLLLAIAISGLSGCDSTLLFLSLDEKDNSEKIFAKYGFFSNLGFLLGSILSTWIINISIDLAAFCTIIPYAISFLLSFILKDIKGEATEKISILKNLKYILNKRNIIIFVITIALIGEVVQSITVFLNQGIYIKSNIDIKYFGLILVFIQIISLLAVRSYKLTNKFGQEKIITIFINVIFVISFFLIFVKNGILAIIGITLISLSMEFIVPIFMDIKNNSIEHSDRATLLSIYSMIESIIAAIISPIIGYSSKYSLESGLMICSIIIFISIMVLSLTKLKNRKIL